jgi:type VI secretion system secreted protein Hcp
MRLTSHRLILKVALPTVAALGAGAAVGIAAIPSADGTIHACYDPASTPAGQVRIVDGDTQQCAAGEQPLDWNQRGPAGPAGPVGPQGPTGSSGGSTPSSTNGADDNRTTTAQDTFSTPTQAGGPSADIFLKLDGIAGESNDNDHKGEIDISSVAIGLGRGGDGTGTTGVAAPATTNSGNRGTAARRARLHTLRIDKIYDAASPKLLQAAATGQRIKSAVLTFRRPSDDDVEFLTYTLTDVQVTSYDQGGRDGDERDLGSLEEEIGLTAGRIRVTTRPIGTDGKPGPAVTANWNVAGTPAPARRP